MSVAAMSRRMKRSDLAVYGLLFTAAVVAVLVITLMVLL